MCIIQDFLVIDQFTLKKEDCIYFLTHWHSDHYQGIVKSWSYGSIYTSHITKRLLLSKYPDLKDIVQSKSLGEWVQISNQKHSIRFKFYDANHMAGSVMILLEIDGKYYFHTGDMRFGYNVALNCEGLLNPIQKGQFQCMYKIQELHLDNTFCDPIFKFPKRSEALELVLNIINDHNPKKVFICTDSIGKEQCFILLSQYFQTKIVINKNRWDYIKQMGIDMKKYFTLNPQQSWIQSIRKNEKDKKIKDNYGSIAITLTGWANLNDYHPIDQKSFIVPYSLHSNFREMEMLVCWMRPKNLIPIVKEREDKWTKFGKKIGTYEQHLYSMTAIKQRGFQFLQKEYCGDSN